MCLACVAAATAALHFVGTRGWFAVSPPRNAARKNEPSGLTRGRSAAGETTPVAVSGGRSRLWESAGEKRENGSGLSIRFKDFWVFGCYYLRSLNPQTGGRESICPSAREPRVDFSPTATVPTTRGDGPLDAQGREYRLCGGLPSPPRECTSFRRPVGFFLNLMGIARALGRPPEA